MAYLNVGDLRLFYEQGGDGPRLLFISGSGGDLRVKPNVFDSPLARAFEVLTYDQRGLGRSDKPPAPYSMADYAADAIALMDALGWDQCPVIGVSFGGMVAQELAVTWPQRVSSLVLACTSPGGEGGSSYPLHEVQHLGEPQRSLKMLPIADRRMTAAWQAANPRALERAVAMGEARRELMDGDADAERGARLQLEARRGHDVWDRLPRLTMPVLLAAGRYDGIAPIANMKAIGQRVPQARLEIFEGGHMFLIQDKTAYPAIIRWVHTNVTSIG